MKRFLFIILITSVFNCKNKPAENIKLTGPVFGTAYNIQYFSEDGINYQAQIDSLFKVINQSLSTYIKDSDISRLNRNEGVEVDTHFARVYKASKSIFIATDGVFDPTIGNVVNAWNFGSENNKFLTDSTTIDSLMQFVGFDKVNLEAGRIIKPDPVYLEFNAIAKGYGIDVICEFLETNGIANFLVDIGGDLKVKGINIQRGAGWTVGIDDPNFDGTQSYSKVVVLKNEAMATSGTYRKYKQDEQGNRYAHIMDTRTGYPTKTNILSASVIAPDCMTADGYATAFQAMGIEEVKLFLRSYPELKVFFIYEDEDQTLNTLALNNFPE